MAGSAVADRHLPWGRRYVPRVFRIEHLGDGKPACGYAGISAIAGLTGFMLGVFPGLLVPGPLFHVRA